jgi:hypothetical protein
MGWAEMSALPFLAFAAALAVIYAIVLGALP